MRGYALSAVLLSCTCAFGLNPSLDINQYAHNAWTIREGFFKGTATAIAQTPDGYLWLGTEFGLLRFDGVRFVPWQPPAPEPLPSNFIIGLLASRDGRLWIGTQAGLASWKDGSLTRYPQLAGQSVGAFIEDQKGTIWAGSVGSSGGRLCSIHADEVKCFGEDGSLGTGVYTLYEHKEEIWAGAQAGLWRWKPGPPQLYRLAGAGLECVMGLNEDDGGHLLLSMLRGMRRIVNEKVEAYTVPGSRQRYRFRQLLRDHGGGLWIGTTDQGLLHVHQGRTDSFAKADGLSGDSIDALFEDREGNVWVATTTGLDRFREFAAPTISVRQELSNDLAWSVLAARDGSVWIGTRDGLDRWKDGKFAVYRKTSGLPGNEPESLFEDDRGRIWVFTTGGLAYFENGHFVPVRTAPSGQVHAIVQDREANLWLNYDQSLVRLRGGRVVEQIPYSRLGVQEYLWDMLPDPVRGGLWLGFGYGLEHVQDARVRVSYSSANGLGAGRVTDLQLDPDGTLWAATQSGLSRLKDGRISTLNSRNGLPCDTVHWAKEDDEHSFWLYMACGLARIPRTELEAWARDPGRTVRMAFFDSSDGVWPHVSTGSGYGPRISKARDGRLWFVTWNGVSVIDPRHLPYNKLPPPVQVEQVIADRKTYAAGAKLPALVRDVEIDYTALSFVAPEKIRFRFKLEGRDRYWHEAGNRRQAFYNDLRPRNYRFRVMAANNDGVWNEAGASVDFSVTPAYYQTTWFAALVVAGFLALVAGLHRLRLVYLTKQINARLEGRVAERTRVARDLHDTLLQSFQGVLLKLSTIPYMMRSRPEQAEEMLKGYIDQARSAIAEARDAVQGLRSSTVMANDLARAITTFGEGLTVDDDGSNRPEFQVFVEGKSRNLPPLVRDEAYKIACECLRNAFRHAQARRIEVQIGYEPRQLRLRFADNGKGIDPVVLSAGGREGHHGLQGLHERAQVAGGKLSVWSQLNSGTEIELTIPGSIAYLKSPASRSASAGKGNES